MRLAIFIVCFALIGCSPEPAPKQFAKPLGDGSSPSQTKPLALSTVKPASTDAASAEMLSKILLAHTDNEPKRLEALKLHQYSRKGTWRFAQQVSDATMTVKAAWPDRYRTTIALEYRQNSPHTITVLGGGGWQIAPAAGMTTPTPLTPDLLENVLADVRAEWIGMLVPLTMPDTRAELLPPTGVTDTPLKLRVWVADHPAVELQVDAKSHRLLAVHFTAMEDGQPIARKLTFSDHRAESGVLLPHTVEYSSGAFASMKWTQIEYSFPNTFTSAEFEKP